MDATITTAAIATIVSGVTSAVVALFIASRNSKKAIDDQLDGILKIAIQYPYLECKDFTNTWSSKYDRSDEKALRYEVYCTLVFNFMTRICDYYKYDKNKIEQHLAIKQWARIHCKYWYDPTEAYENVDTYDKQFVDLIEGYLKGAK